MFGIPDKHIDNIAMKKLDINNYGESLIEECGELITALAKHQGDRYTSWNSSRRQIYEEMTHVLISMNLVCKELQITQHEINSEVKRKSLDEGWDFTEYDW